MNINTLLTMYVRINIFGSLLVVFSIPLMDGLLEDIKRAVKIKHLFLILFLLLFLPCFLLVGLIFLLVEHCDNIGILFVRLFNVLKKLLNKTIIDFEKGC